MVRALGMGALSNPDFFAKKSLILGSLVGGCSRRHLRHSRGCGLREVRKRTHPSLEIEKFCCVSPTPRSLAWG